MPASSLAQSDKYYCVHNVSVDLDRLIEKVNWQSICLSTLLTNIGVLIVLTSFSDVIEIRMSQFCIGICWRT